MRLKASEGKRGTIACLVLVTMLVPFILGIDGCPGTSPILPGIGGSSQYVGADVCVNCHRGVHAAWTVSPHAKALETLKSTSDQNNPSCLPCHTTGYGAGGFVSAFATPKFGGVQCESCHGPAGKHVGTRKPEDIVRLPLSDVCGGCHTGAAQPDHDEWLTSRHALAVQSVRADASASDDCLTCHSFDYMAGLRRNETRAAGGLPLLALPSLEDGSVSTDPKEGVGCSSCHSPHGSSFASELRNGITALCVTCHADSQLSPGRLPHAPQQNLLMGQGGLVADDGPAHPTAALSGVPSVHAQLEEFGGCVKCHGEKRRLDHPTDAMPNQHGHTFEISYTNCTPCHDATEAEAATTNRKATTAARLVALRQRADSLDPAALSGGNKDRLKAAVLDLDLVEMDGSGGIHNVVYVDSLFDAAETLLDRIEAGP